MSNLGKQLLGARIKNGLTLRALAEIVGVSFSALARIERGVGTPTQHTIDRVNRWLKTGGGSGPRIRESRGLHWTHKIELRLLHLEGVVEGLLGRVERMEREYFEAFRSLITEAKDEK